MPEDEENKPEVEVELEASETEQGSVEVDTGEPKTPKYITEEEFEKIKKQSSYTQRKLDKAIKRLEEMTMARQEPDRAYSAPSATNDEILSRKSFDEFSEKELDSLTPQEINRIAENDWQLAVDLRTAKVIRAQENKKKGEAKRQTEVSTLEKSKATVLERYPDIDNGQSKEAQLYIQILNENPHLLSNVNGPELAMYKMEDRMRQNGMQPSAYREAMNSAVDQEVQRRQRIGAGALPYGSAPTSDKVMLTQDEIQTAKDNNIPLEQFAKSYKLTQRDFKEGVTVDE